MLLLFRGEIGSKHFMKYINYINRIFGILNKKQKIHLVLVLVVITIGAVFELLGVSAILPLVTAVTNPEEISQNKLYSIMWNVIGASSIEQYVVICSLLLAAVYILKNAFLFFQNIVTFKYTYSVQQSIAVRLMKYYMLKDYTFHTSHNVVELQRNISTDVGAYVNTLVNIISFISELLVSAFLIIFLAATDWMTTLLMVIMLGLFLGLYFFAFKGRVKKLGIASRDLIAIQNKYMLEAFGGIKEIKAMSKEDYFIDHYDDAYTDAVKIQRKQVLFNYFPKPLMETLSICTILILVAVKVGSGTPLSSFITVLTVFAMAAIRMLPAFNRISGFLGSLMFQKSSVDALTNELMVMNNDKEDIQESSNKEISFTQSIELMHVAYSYPLKPNIQVLKDINLSIPHNKSVALIGSSGGGKTTVADVILGLLKPAKGNVEVDGINIHDNLKKWHNMLAYIPQNIYLTDGTVRDNVAFGVSDEEIDDNLIWQALEEAQLADFFKSQPEGIYSTVGDRGVQLSGGQRQRIGIARALYNRPQLLILDEATSALDNETESAVMDAIYNLSGKVTMLIIAHRLTTIKNCDYIYEISDGKAILRTYEQLQQ